MDSMPIFRSDVSDRTSFELLLGLYGCRISSIEDAYYIVEGTPENLEDFRKYWSEAGGMQ